MSGYNHTVSNHQSELTLNNIQIKASSLFKDGDVISCVYNESCGTKSLTYQKTTIPLKSDDIIFAKDGDTVIFNVSSKRDRLQLTQLNVPTGNISAQSAGQNEQKNASTAMMKYFDKNYDQDKVHSVKEMIKKRVEEYKERKEEIKEVKAALKYSVANASAGVMNKLMARGISFSGTNIAELAEVISDIQMTDLGESAGESADEPPITVTEAAPAGTQAATTERAEYVDESKKNTNYAAKKHAPARTETEETETSDANEKIIAYLKKNNLPLTGGNISQLNTIFKTIADAKHMTEADILTAIKNSGDKPVQLSDVYVALHTPANEHENATITPEIKAALEQFLKSANMPVSEKNLEIVSILYKNNLPVTMSNYQKFIELTSLSEMDIDALLAKAVLNIKKGEAVLDIPILPENEPYTLLNKYNDIKNALFGAQNTNINQYIKIDITMMSFTYAYAKYRNELTPISSSAYMSQMKSAFELQMRLSANMVGRLAAHALDITDLPLKQALKTLDALEQSVSAGALSKFNANTAEHMHKMTATASAIRLSMHMQPEVYGDIIQKNISFNLSAISSSVTKYMESATEVNPKFGDKFSNVVGQFEGLLTSLSIEVSKQSVKAASSLSRCHIDVTEQNIHAFMAVDYKMSRLQAALNPIVVASMINEHVDILNEHVDNLLAYAEQFNENNSIEQKLKFAEMIHQIDKNGDLEKADRDSLIAAYKALHQIEQHGLSAAAMLLKTGADITLKNLLDMSSSYKKHIDVKADTEFSGIESLFSGNLRIKEALAAATREKEGMLTEAQRNLLEDSILGVTSKNMDIVQALSENGVLDEQNALKLAYVNEQLSDLAHQFNETKPADYLNMGLAELRAYIDGAKNENTAAQNDAKRLEQIANIPSSYVKYMKQKNIPLNLNHMEAFKELVNHPFMLKDKLDDTALDTSDMDMINDLQAQHKLTGKALRAFYEEDVENYSSVKALSALYYGLNVTKSLHAADNRFSYMPMKHGAMSHELNVFMLSEDAFAKEEVTSLLSIQTEHMGQIEGALTLFENHISLTLSARDTKYNAYLENEFLSLSETLAGMGYNLSVAIGTFEAANPLKEETRAAGGNELPTNYDFNVVV